MQRTNIVELKPSKKQKSILLECMYLSSCGAFGIQYHKIQNKAEEFGIDYNQITEEYSSQECPVCGVSERHHKKDRIFLCSFCDFFWHRDLVGAKNIMRKGMRGLSESTHLGETAHLGGDCYATAF